MDHDVIALTDCRIYLIEHAALRSLIRARPNVAEALWRETLIDAAIFREWIVNVGSRPAEERAAHLILEVAKRLAAIGRGGDEFELPLTQEEFGEALGVTPIHVNRVLKTLRDSGLVTFRRQTVQIHDKARLEKFGDFSALYLHQNPTS
jgi:CRP-like cAMP-binding protein